MMLFHEIVEKMIDNPKGKLTHLIKYTKGDAKDIIKHCVQQPPTQGFKNAKALLKRKYGNPYNNNDYVQERKQGLATSQEW